MSRVSILLTSYNHAKYLRESIDSVLNQTFPDFEVFILDDASTDDSWNIINSYSDPRIQAFRNDTNQQEDLFLKVFPKAITGEYIAIHHSDDVWEPEKLKEQVDFMDTHPDIGAVFTHVQIIREDGKPFNDKTHFYYKIFDQPNRSRHEWLNFFFYHVNALCHPSVLIRKVCYEQCGFLRHELWQLADLDMWIRLCLKYEIYVLPDRLIKYRVRDNEANTSGNQPEKRIRWVYEFYKTLENYKKIERFDDLIKIFPFAEKYNRGKETDIHFVLAMIALEEKPFIMTELFGLDILFELISDPIRAAKIKRLYNFDYMNFIDLTGKHDVFSVGHVSQITAERDGQIANLNQAVTERDGEITKLNQAVAERDGKIDAMYKSISWRITWPLRIVGNQMIRIRRVTERAIPALRRGLRIVANSVIFKGKVNKEPTEQYIHLSDARRSEMKSDEIRFHSQTSILFVGHDAHLGGAEILLLSLIKWFSEHTGIEIKIVLLRGGMLLDKFKNIAPVLLWEDLVRNVPVKEPRINELHKFTGKVDLIYGNTVLAPAIYDELEFLGAPFITHVHELEETIKSYVEKATIHKMRSLTHGFIAASNPVYSNLIDNHSIDKNNIITINDFIEKKEIGFDISKKDLRNKLGLIEKGLIVFGCGATCLRKGVDLFIDTALLLKKKGYKDFHFYWIGENYWDDDHVSRQLCSWSDLEEKINNAGLWSHITFLGVKENVTDYFLAGDIFYLPSREDPFPLVCLEAAECSIPVICFENAGGMPDFVENDAGFVVPYEDINEAVERIIFLDNNRDKLNELGATARKKFLSRHTLDIAAPEILNFCRKIGNMPPAVSVIVPNYNCERYLVKRLDSIIDQTFKDIELIILDDASTDRSLEIIEKYLHLPYVKLYKDRDNSGNPFIQWHKGYSQAKGDILWFAEGDDFCKPDFLQKLLQSFNDGFVALAYCDSVIVDEADNVKGDYKSYLDKLHPDHWKSSYHVTDTQEINYGLGVKNSIPNASAVLIRKSCVSDAIFNETFQFKFSGDWFFYTQLIKGKDIAFCSEKLNYHRKHGETVTSKFNTDKSAIQLLLAEQIRIHEIILKSFTIDLLFLNKWEKHISSQIPTWYPIISEDDLDKYYPYSLTKEEIKCAIIKNNQNKRLIFLTTNDYSSNGGSEQLWRQAAIECKKRGYDVVVVIKKWDPEPFFIKDLYDVGIKIVFKEHNYFKHVIRFNPHLMVISIGDQDEGIDEYEFCQKNKIPYVIVNQLTKEPVYWPISKDINEQVKKGYLGAGIVLFTGKNNHEVMEKRLGCTIPNTGIIYNPFDVDRYTAIPFPSMENGLKIALVASLSRVHKGQHLAIELFNLKKWRDRPIHLNLYGEGYDEAVLKKQARDYNLKNVTFHGHTNDILAVWKENHAIFMPSFMEGLPLALVGAMICARVPIVTDIGAHREVIDDNISGFIAKEPTVEALDEALERAYQRSGEWEEIGQKARKKILSIVPEDPIDDFILKIVPFANKK